MANFVFMGTPEFAVPSLKALFQYCESHGHRLLHVVCQPDRPAGRGKKLKAPPVKEAALEMALDVYQPATLKKGTEPGDTYFAHFEKEDIDVAVVVAYGRILPNRFLRHPRCGFVNVHGSLLPRWRGAAPIQRAVEAGDTETGVCIMKVVPELDAGDVYLEKRIPILDSDTSGSLFQSLAELGGRALAEAMAGILDGSLAATAQDAAQVTHASMLSKDEGLIDWAGSAEVWWRKSRAFTPWPGLHTVADGKPLKLHGADLKERHGATGAPGEVLALGDSIVMQMGEGTLTFSQGQPPGKKPLSAGDLRNGGFLKVGQILGQ